jgi:hypothetical protein
MVEGETHQAAGRTIDALFEQRTELALVHDGEGPIIAVAVSQDFAVRRTRGGHHFVAWVEKLAAADAERSI